MPEKDISISRLREAFWYNPETGDLTWKSSSINNRIRPGRLAGYVDTSRGGYIRVILDGVKMGAHRVCFAIHHGRWPTEEIDHINRIRTDNRACNLRECSRVDNAQNRKVTARTGVTLQRDTGKYSAAIGAFGKRYHLGSFNTPEEANAAYLEAKLRMHTPAISVD